MTLGKVKDPDNSLIQNKDVKQVDNIWASKTDIDKYHNFYSGFFQPFSLDEIKQKIRKYPQNKANQVITLTNIIKNKHYHVDRIIELGCGRSYLGRYLEEEMDLPLICIDKNQTLLDELKKDGYRTKNMDLLKESFDYDKDDLIISLHSRNEMTNNIIKSIVTSKQRLSGCIVPCYDKDVTTENYQWLSNVFKENKVVVFHDLSKDSVIDQDQLLGINKDHLRNKARDVVQKVNNKMDQLLEYLIIIDKKFYLEENGYKVSLYKLDDKATRENLVLWFRKN